MPSPLISVVIPTYNPGAHLRELITSLEADPTPKEILLIDDGSRKPVEPLTSGMDVTVHRLRRNRGPATAQNVGLRLARSKYVTFVDQDDLLAPDALTWRAVWLEKHPERQAVMGSVAGILDDRSHTSYRMLLKKRFHTLPKTVDLSFFKAGGWMPLSPLSLCLFRKSLLKKVGRFDRLLSCAHDREYLYRVLNHTSIDFVDRSTLFYRIHDKNQSVQLRDGKITPKRRTLAELCLIHLEHGIPTPQKIA